MKKILLALSVTLITLSSCEKEETHTKLDINEKSHFTGTFEAIDSKKMPINVSLTISDEHYKCFTNLPFGVGAGKLDISETTIDFIDTLFFVKPANYGPTFVLSGKYNYKYDGENLTIRKDDDAENTEYKLKKLDVKEIDETVLKLYTMFKNGEISECKHNGKTVYSAGLNAYDAGGSIFDNEGEVIGSCNYAWGNVDDICKELENCEVIYRVENNIWGLPAVDIYGLGK
ncbi:MAG: hypothetical protein ABFR62_14225 [Bacteroidota bacterium]